MSTWITPADQQWLDGTYDRLISKISAECDRVGGSVVYVPENGHYVDLATPTGLYWWCNGFWPGMLWLSYHATGDEKFRKAAETIEERLDDAISGYEGLHHDVGFMWTLSALADYRLTGNKRSRVRALHAASLLAGRYNPRAKFLRAWNMDRSGWTIADTMMNLPLLYWAAKEIDDPRFDFIARDHADTCARVTVRDDGSSYHISIMDPMNGEILERRGGQGFAEESAWSRGQSWVVYGYALSYLHTKDPKYLNIAKQAAHYFISNLAINDWLPLCDFRAPAEPLLYDSTAGAIAACGFLEIAEHVEEHEKPLYRNAAIKVLKAMEERFCCWDNSIDGILGYGSKSYHEQVDRHVSIIYGDYYFTEAILRLKGKGFGIW